MLAVTDRQKLLATVVASYAVACLAVGVCSELITTRYEAAVESAENLHLHTMLNRQIDDLAWHRYADGIRALARDISQEPGIRRLVEAGNSASLEAALPQ